MNGGDWNPPPPNTFNAPPPCVSDPIFYTHGLVLPRHATILKRIQSTYEMYMVGIH